jgi:hypothetical protein
MPRQRSKRIGGRAGGDWPAMIGPHDSGTQAALFGLGARLELKQHAVTFVELAERRAVDRERAEKNIGSAGIGRDEAIPLVFDQRGDNTLRQRRLFGFRSGFHSLTNFARFGVGSYFIVSICRAVGKSNEWGPGREFSRIPLPRGRRVETVVTIAPPGRDDFSAAQPPTIALLRRPMLGSAKIDLYFRLTRTALGKPVRSYDD